MPDLVYKLMWPLLKNVDYGSGYGQQLPALS